MSNVLNAAQREAVTTTPDIEVAYKCSWCSDVTCDGCNYDPVAIRRLITERNKIARCDCGRLSPMKLEWRLSVQTMSDFCQGCADQCPEWRYYGYDNECVEEEFGSAVVTPYDECMIELAVEERQFVEKSLQALPKLGFIELPTELRGLIADYVADYVDYVDYAADYAADYVADYVVEA